MRMFVEYNFISNDIAHKLMMIPVNYWCGKNVDTITLSIKDGCINVNVLLDDGSSKTFLKEISSTYKFYCDTDSAKDEITKIVNTLREDVKIFSSKNYLNKLYGKDSTMGKAISNKQGFMKLCDNMDNLTSQLGPDNIKLMRFENNEAILQVFDREVTVNLDEVENMDYKQFMFNIAEAYSDENVNKES